MNLNIAKERLSSVAKPDSITTSQSDFLATHVAINRLHLLDRFEIMPEGGEDYSEEDIYRRFVLNSENKHQLVVIYGVSGTGKSHLIRWFEAKYRNDKNENEVVLFVRRSDNTLKGTIRQLLRLSEVQDIANKDIYQRLLSAVAFEDENKLKGRIYHDFLNEIQNDKGDHSIELSNLKRKRLSAFMSDEVVQKHLMDPDGPIERIYSKVAENSLVDRDTIAEFKTSDFCFSLDLFDALSRSGASQSAEKMARELMADESGVEEAENIANYLNQFINDVVQRCAGIEAGDFRDIFQDIRKELYRQGKNLTLFIEDITSFTGVDEALLDSLVVEHTGLNAKEKLCRVSSFVGTTNNYLQNNFRDNHKDRITQYIYIPSDAFDEEGIFEFVGRYLNTMSLPEGVIEEWVKNHAFPSDYPIHELTDGGNWEFVPIEYNKKLNLYPFTKRCIIYLYQHELTKGHQTPRYIIKDIIEPIVNDILWNKDNFPSIKYNIVDINTSLSYRINSQIQDEHQEERLFRFLSIWGDGKPEQYTSQDGTIYISSIKKNILKELDLPEIDFAEIPMSEKSSDDDDTVPNKGKDEEKTVSKTNNSINKESRDIVSKSINTLVEWSNGREIDASANVGTSGTLRAAQEDICEYLMSSINWQDEGISQDNMTKIKNSSVKLVTYENQMKSNHKGFYELPADRASVNVISAFIRWRVYGSQSWNYPDSDLDVFLITTWSSSIKEKILNEVREHLEADTTYIEAAISAEIYKMILYGEYKNKDLEKISPKDLMEKKEFITNKVYHSKEWKILLDTMAHNVADTTNRETIRQYFNITQGDARSIIVLNDPLLNEVIEKVKKNRLSLPSSVLMTKDFVKQRRDVYDYYKLIVNRIEKVSYAELNAGTSALENVCKCFDKKEIDEDDIIELAEEANKFYEEVNKSRINIKIDSYYEKNVKENATMISKSLKTIANVVTETEPLNILMAFSEDPIAELQSLLALLKQLQIDFMKVDEKILKRKESTDDKTNYSSYTAEDVGYDRELDLINKCISLIGED